MHIFRHAIPRDDNSRAVRTEDRVGGIVHVGGRIVPEFRENLVGVVAGEISLHAARKFPTSVAVGRHFACITADRCHRRTSDENRRAEFRFMFVEGTVAGKDIRNRPSDAFAGDFQTEGVIRLQQNGLFPHQRSHQTLTDSTVGRFSEVPADRVLEMRPSGNQRNLHIRDRRTGHHTEMLLFLQMRENEPLPVPFQKIFAAD